MTRLRNDVVKGFTGSIYDDLNKKADQILNESFERQRNFSQTASYDIFLSHSSSDKKLVSGLKLELNDLGYSVYIDWIDDPNVDRSRVTKTNAHLLQTRMKQSKSLIYAFSENASTSRWMPWELGYFDGIKGTVAVLPISKSSKNSFQGEEYLGIYPYIQLDSVKGSENMALWVHETSSKYIIYSGWLNGAKPTQR